MNMNAHEYDYQCTVCLHKDIQESYNVKQHEMPNHPKELRTPWLTRTYLSQSLSWLISSEVLQKWLKHNWITFPKAGQMVACRAAILSR